jgi:hypothetical protein
MVGEVGELHGFTLLEIYSTESNRRIQNVMSKIQQIL